MAVKNPIVWAAVLQEARERCPNGCRNAVIGGQPSTCRRCEEAAKLAWAMVQQERDRLAPPSLITGLDQPHPEAGPHNHAAWKSGPCQECCNAMQAEARQRAITRKPESCQHLQFTAQADVMRLEDISRWVAELRIWCIDCGLPFSFTGLPLGISVDRPTLSIDATEVRLPLEPGPKPIPLGGTIQVDVPRRRES